MVIIGITGPTGAGKSSVCEVIKSKYKAEIIDADKVARELQDNKTEYYTEIIKTFGEEILFDNGFINRSALAQIVFFDEEKKKQLDMLTSKYVCNEIKNRIEVLKKDNLDYIIVDAPTLIETGMQTMFDKIIVVIAKEDDRLIRICKRDDISKEYAELRMQAQKENEFYTKYADFVILNEDKTLEDKVRTVFEEIGR